MSSGRYVTIKLDPYYQVFLRAHFNQYEQVFSFPKSHDLLIRLEYYLSPVPKDFIPQPDTNAENFRIAIPYMEHKNPDYYNYLSEKAQSLFVSRIRKYYNIIIHEEISEARRKGFRKNEIVLKIMEDFTLTNFSEDRMKRDYTRYLTAERFRRFANKSNYKKNLAS